MHASGLDKPFQVSVNESIFSNTWNGPILAISDCVPVDVPSRIRAMISRHPFDRTGQIDAMLSHFANQVPIKPRT